MFIQEIPNMEASHFSLWFDTIYVTLFNVSMGNLGVNIHKITVYAVYTYSN